MNRYFITSIFLTIGVLESVYGLRWLPIVENRGNFKLPKNIIKIDESVTGEQTWVGRAKTPSGEIYPADIDSSRIAHYKRYDYNRTKFQSSLRSELLTTAPSDYCQWKFRNNLLILQNAVRAGVDSNGDPIFVGKFQNSDGSMYIDSVFLPTGKYTQNYENINKYFRTQQWQYLSCDTKNEWVDYETTHLPDNAVSGGKSINKYEIYVARLQLADGNFITGYVIPEMNATVFDDVPLIRTYPYHLLTDSDKLMIKNNNHGYKEKEIEELNENYDKTSDSDVDVVEILVGKLGEYEWVSIENGTIPDYAVVNGKKNMEPAYVARINKSIRHITQTEARDQKSSYEILIKNEIEFLVYESFESEY